MAINTPAIATAIANLSVSGVTMKDITAIPSSITKANCPIFFPHPDEWEQGVESAPNTDFVGQAGIYDAVHTLRYIFLYDLSTAANPMSSIYSAMATKADLIWTALNTLNSKAGVLTVTHIARSRFGELLAPQVGTSQIRNVFFGCYFDIQISELSNS